MNRYKVIRKCSRRPFDLDLKTGSHSYNVNMDDNVKIETLSCRIIFFPPYICFMSVVLYDVCQCTRQFDISDTGYSTYVIL